MLIGVGTLAVGVLLSVPLVRFLLFPLFRRTTETSWSKVGGVQDFASITEPRKTVITVRRRDGWRLVVSRKPVYVLPQGEVPHRVLSPICPHLGCMVEWMQKKRQFICPCHGSRFTADGSLAEGPALRGMDYLDSKVEEGELMVRYQYFQLLVPDRKVIG
jgi:menaquinol-cytochrome c reductase iron-sulfur subunit